MKRIFCATLDGVDAKVVEVESSFIQALPALSIVGLASSAIQEAKDRVKSALLAQNFKFPPQKITINLAPSDLKKSGSHFDLAIALGIALQKENVDFDDYFVFGELGLDGKVKDTTLIFPLLLSLAKSPIKAVVPMQSMDKFSKIPNLTLIGVRTLAEAIEFFRTRQAPVYEGKQLSYPFIECDNSRYYYDTEYELDFADVKGQHRAIKAALIAAIGMHNILMEGSPGCGKSMIAKRLRYILPPMSMKEMLEVARMEALDGKEPDFRPLRPMRAPHHSSSKPSIFGGGSRGAKPGEVAMANHGILFFDEFPHFSKSVLEALREPLQDQKVLISRVNSKIEYATSFLFVAAQNPCPCGNLLSDVKPCRCSEAEILRYKNRLSDPLLDRIEIYVQMDEVTSDEKSLSDSATLHQKVLAATLFRLKRGQRKPNGKLEEKEITALAVADDAKVVLDQAVHNLHLSQRAINNTIKVARTIADLQECETIGKSHILEALSYRRR